ncbi:hypothetical protein [Nakamurella sp. PAMC28650]|uniref:hypothetical protein n=1 Tax=Nakamurella sp. PAMC28650 TaxID=2762325 RepID=UPI00164D333D|nr:hypothetical protein [Nakamurella sp. PAMC28650]QNK80375.1 hypothetical protein H7F38_19595 [Nakamurella sp. PAMC28650]
MNTRTNSTPTPSEIHRTWRLYQPDTRAISSSYQCSISSLQPLMSTCADRVSDSRYVFSAPSPSPPICARTASIVVALRSGSGTIRSTTARAKVRPDR